MSVILEYLGDQIEHENCCAAVLKWIAETQCKSESNLPDLVPLYVWRVFDVHKLNPVIAEHGFTILTHCTSVGKMHVKEASHIASNMEPSAPVYFEKLLDNSIYWNYNTLKVIYDLTLRHMDSLCVHRNSLALLEAIFCPTDRISLQNKAENEYWLKYSPIYRTVAEIGFPEIIIKALMKVHMGYADILRPALSILWKLCIDRMF